MRHRGTAPATVYRFYSSTGELLYIGCSTNLATRLGAHVYQTHWFAEVTSVGIEHHADSRSAFAAEAAAIAVEAPRYNVRHAAPRPRRARPRLPEPVVNGSALRSIRTDRGLTVSALAAATGIGQSHLSNVELGRRLASRDVMAALASQLDVDVSAITIQAVA